MDSQFITILIGVVITIGLASLEKLIGKTKSGNQRRESSRQNTARPNVVERQARPPLPRPSRRPVMPEPPLVPPVIEGERVTVDVQQPVEHQEAPARFDLMHEDMRKAIIWSEILNKPKFKDF